MVLGIILDFDKKSYPHIFFAAIQMPVILLLVLFYNNSLICL